MKIAVIGPIPRDTITTHKGEVIKKYGCVTHPAIGISKLLDETDTVVPISNVHRKDHQPIVELFKPFNNIDVSGLNSTGDQGTIIELKFIDQNNRIEKQLTNMTPIRPDHVANHLDSDCFVFVPITDFEIELDTLKYIKSNSKAMVVFDAHGPTTYVNETCDRLRQYWKDKSDWLPYIDVLKMNLEESLCCWFDMDYNDASFYDENNTAHLDEFAAWVLEKGVTYLYVTLDSRGCALYMKEDGAIAKTFINSVPVEDVVDTTGCGDSFAGGLAFGFTAFNDPVKAAQYANVLGARRTQGIGFDVFRSLEETDAIIQNIY
ncbi:MAG: carbohydrate kinase family protein [Flavobacteriaceae bacterium]|nr:carbohydrate kinase family protein [Bacteroidia bacterium]MBT8286550.1 carbohydrate kinase family protein [Bacteroidia bacterium]NNF76367.1 carbohydrate kinase family protein [Flavobacteriaceae bacterium]NNK72055.1 carbohydrate kinase family protein [Flavobacteriaceae bacterium]